jgi:cytochrome bd ubiquinol oxidase subunit II
MTLAAFLASVMLVALVAYAVLAGADFGAGIWDLLSVGPRRRLHRQALSAAIGPVWEANHVWLIFLIVLLFTCFPAAYARASVDLFWPLHLVLIGIVLRGVAFVFRAYGSERASAQAAWGRIFGAASAVTPMLLGMSLGTISADGQAWIDRFPLVVGILALLICAYLAAVYLAWETDDADVKEDFRRRAIACWLVAGIISLLTLLLTRHDAPRLWAGLTSWPAGLFVTGGTLLAPLSLAALYRRRFSRARLFGAAQVVALLLGWGVAQWPYLIYPEVTVTAAAAPRSTLALTAASLPLGAAVLVPSLWFLFAVFKKRRAV